MFPVSEEMTGGLGLGLGQGLDLCPGQRLGGRSRTAKELEPEHRRGPSQGPEQGWGPRPELGQGQRLGLR